MKYTAEEVRKSADWLYQWERKAGARNARAMLTAYAERIEADEVAVTDLVVDKICNAALGHDNYGYETQDQVRTALLSVWPNPSAQATQVDLRNSLLRGKAQNEEPRVRHSCNMGVGCEETGICYAEANGQPEQCGRPTAEPVAQPADSGRVPDGWVLVPVEPTEAMQTAHHIYGDTSDWWSAVIAAAPSAPEGGA